MACGYHFKVTGFETRPKESRITVTNTGVAPIYYDAYPAVNGVRAKDSLKFPGTRREPAIHGGLRRCEARFDHWSAIAWRRGSASNTMRTCSKASADLERIAQF